MERSRRMISIDGNNIKIMGDLNAVMTDWTAITGVIHSALSDALGTEKANEMLVGCIFQVVEINKNMEKGE
jgi:hypothetical protein